ncbi:hypothetical protein E2I00_001577 [Balaenoptera physalus]|uniref:VWFA domain-containing protein n=1 Tax=Balaenoptera physalus TaxID=9770 RepID=A0A6A1QEV7_BALPH|nr:hypothetical protein E2I00_001577 [Balaenoptera physalus]
MLLLGVGSEAVRAELEEVTGSSEHIMIYAGPQDLFGQIPKLQGMRCSQQCLGCQAQSLDLVFMLDASASVGPEDFAQMQSFVRRCALRFDKLRDNGVSVLVMGVRPVLREALRRLTGPRDSLIHVAAYADLRHHRDTFIEWICRGALRGDAPKARGPSREPAGGQQLPPSQLLPRRPGSPGR